MMETSCPRGGDVSCSATLPSSAAALLPPRASERAGEPRAPPPPPPPPPSSSLESARLNLTAACTAVPAWLSTPMSRFCCSTSTPTRASSISLAASSLSILLASSSEMRASSASSSSRLAPLFSRAFSRSASRRFFLRAWFTLTRPSEPMALVLVCSASSRSRARTPPSSWPTSLSSWRRWSSSSAFSSSSSASSFCSTVLLILCSTSTSRLWLMSVSCIASRMVSSWCTRELASSMRLVSSDSRRRSSSSRAAMRSSASSSRRSRSLPYSPM
mmetsp:Transcript_11045/g.30265  ORF Transcript_11045/g.30265 Transcript_11045/m.30265 type:complete len:273 (-) Transcript_11045:474-1292(-)